MSTIHESGEMYLETILLLIKSKGSVRACDVVAERGYSKSSVSRGVNLLKDAGYINVADDGEITFTPTGKAIAEETYSRHCVLTELLVKLGVSPDVAESDACRVEHDISAETFAALRRLCDSLK